MGLFSKNKPLFTEDEQQLILRAISEAERNTSGEIRLFVENKCAYVDALDRAKEIFFQLHMQATALHNAVLVYVALKDKQLAVYGDAGIHNAVGTTFWNATIKQAIGNFNKQCYAQGIAEIITTIGVALQTHFPYDANTDRNELPDEIVFGQ